MDFKRNSNSILLLSSKRLNELISMHIPWLPLVTHTVSDNTQQFELVSLITSWN